MEKRERTVRERIEQTAHDIMCDCDRIERLVGELRLSKDTKKDQLRRIESAAMAARLHADGIFSALDDKGETNDSDK
tara:strand:+ start:403 stop:633 length:231 start_codon:yes stop_codon:yes gene_type:complete